MTHYDLCGGTVTSKDQLSRLKCSCKYLVQNHRPTTIEKATDLSLKLTDLLAQSGFRLTKFMSNRNGAVKSYEAVEGGVYKATKIMEQRYYASKIAVNFCYTIYKIYTKPSSLLTIAIDLTRSLRHRFRKTFVFTRPYVYAKPAFSKISTLESVFENLRFRLPKTPFTCGCIGKTEEKTSEKKNQLKKMN